MKKAYVLLSLVSLITILGVWWSLNTTTLSYIPKFVRDAHYYLQAQMLADEELVKYLLYKAKMDGKECLNVLQLNYPKSNDTIEIHYHYPIAQCKDFKLHSINKDANLSQDGIIIAHISVALNRGKNVNDEILINKTFILHARDLFWD